MADRLLVVYGALAYLELILSVGITMHVGGQEGSKIDR